MGGHTYYAEFGSLEKAQQRLWSEYMKTVENWGLFVRSAKLEWLDDKKVWAVSLRVTK